MLHTSIRITSINSVHVRFDVFTGTYSGDIPPERLTRGLAGKLCIDTETAEVFILGFPGLVKVTTLTSKTALNMLPRICERVLRDLQGMDFVEEERYLE